MQLNKKQFSVGPKVCRRPRAQPSQGLNNRYFVLLVHLEALRCKSQVWVTNLYTTYIWRENHWKCININLALPCDGLMSFFSTEHGPSTSYMALDFIFSLAFLMSLWLTKILWNTKSCDLSYIHWWTEMKRTADFCAKEYEGYCSFTQWSFLNCCCPPEYSVNICKVL